MTFTITTNHRTALNVRNRFFRGAPALIPSGVALKQIVSNTGYSVITLVLTENDISRVFFLGMDVQRQKGPEDFDAYGNYPLEKAKKLIDFPTPVPSVNPSGLESHSMSV